MGGVTLDLEVLGGTSEVTPLRFQVPPGSILTRFCAVLVLIEAFRWGRRVFIPGFWRVFRVETSENHGGTSMYLQSLSMWHDGCGVTTLVESFIVAFIHVLYVQRKGSGYFLTIPYPIPITATHPTGNLN